MSDELLSPFIEKSLACPACGQAAAQPFFKSRLFVPGERESDQHVLTYNWLAPNVRQVPPAFYAVLKCPTCHFADLREDFQTPSENPFNRRIIKAFKSAGQKDKLIMELLARHIQYPDLDFGSALNLHFLALYAQMLLPAESCDTYKIARLLLRVAWLYRENTPDEEGNLQLPTVDEIQKNLTAFENQLYQARTESERVSAGLRQRATELSDTFDGERRGRKSLPEIPHRPDSPVRGASLGNLPDQASSASGSARRTRIGRTGRNGLFYFPQLPSLL
jgi:uncharacterized protein (DUF2225 family)